MGPRKHARENSFSMLCSSCCYVDGITFNFPVAIVFSVVFALSYIVLLLLNCYSLSCAVIWVSSVVSVKFLANVVLLSFRHTSMCNQFIERSCEHVIQSGLCLNDNSLS